MEIRQQKKARSIHFFIDSMIKVFIAEIVTWQAQKELVNQRMEELDQLVTTYWGMSIVKTIQQRTIPNYKTYIWSGKLEEVIRDMQLCDAQILIFGNILKPAQIYNVNEIMREASRDRDLQIQAWDRVDLILKIFDRHASSTEARLQIELASIKHMGPRIYDMSMELGKQGAGTGSKWSGESNTEIMRRHLELRRKQIQKQLAKYEQVRETHRQSRQKKHLPTIGLVWYTNAGKSSLMNSLTNKWVLVEDKLFATLGTDVGKLYIPNMEWGKGTELLINDTIWFIRDLPPGLIQAFKSTLEDSIEANILLHTIDASDELRDDKVRVVDEILDDIWAEQERVYVLNKIDKLEESRENREEKIEKHKDCHTEWSVAEWLNEMPLGAKCATLDGSESHPSTRSSSLRPAQDDTIQAHQTIEQKKQRLESYCEEYQYDAPTIIAVSAHTWEGMEQLKELMVEKTKWRK